MMNLKQFIQVNYIIFALTGCAWQQNPTPATLDNSVYNQDAQNIILHSASNSLESKLLFSGTDNNSNYITVYALTLKNKPTALSIISTPDNNTYFVNLLKSEDINNTLFSANTNIIHSETTITKASYNNIPNATAKAYLDSLGFNSTNSFIKRTTYFYKNQETLTLVDYIFPNQQTNRFDD